MPSIVRGVDDFDSLESQGLGDGQTWQDVTASRSVGVTYTNSTGRAIEVVAKGTNDTAGGFMSLSLNGISIGVVARFNGSGSHGAFSFTVPDGNTYSLGFTNSSLSVWLELR